MAEAGSASLEDRVREIERLVRKLVSGTEPELRLRSEDGRHETVLRGNGIVVYEDGAPRISAVVADGLPRLTLFGPGSLPLVGLDASLGSSGLRFFDNDGNPRCEIQVTEGLPCLAYLDPNGQRRLEIEMNPNGVDVAVYDKDGQPRAVFSMDNDGTTSCSFENDAGAAVSD